MPRHLSHALIRHLLSTLRVLARDLDDTREWTSQPQPLWVVTGKHPLAR